ncbi:MAG TPA: FGGY family carbohydrate kinase, partial [Gaiellales bacterium]|nr:FGGY family carbohydrate kinase [Gaiellales bacterium]
MKPPVLLAIDQGSSSSRCVAYDERLRVAAAAARPVTTARPGPGMVEHDAVELLDGVCAALAEVRREVDAPVAGIGIANQTETFLLWEAGSGEAVTPVISWQDQRAGELCARLAEDPAAERVAAVTGLGLDATFSAPKLAWLFERNPGLRSRAEAGELRFGDVACWLAWKLSAGAGHVSEPSNACRSLLVDLATLDWDEGLLGLFGIPRPLLPVIRPSDDSGLVTDGDVAGFQAPVAAMLGDQPAALFGQGCTRPRMAALTLGTGAFLWLNAGPERPQPPPGVLATAAWDSRRAGRAYALEAFCANAGNALAVLARVGL